MSRTKFPQGEPEDAKGVWGGLARQAGRSAVVSCPNCGKSASLTDHTIEENGDVNPSLVCPYDCEFHEYVTLDGWVPNPRKK